MAVVLACVVGTSHLDSAWAQKPGASAADMEQAKKHMTAGVAFMRNPDGARYEEAYAEFAKAYELSGSLNALQNLAICAQNLELDGEAIDHYEKFLQGKGDSLDAATKQQVESDLAALKSAVSWVTFSTDKVGVTITDTRFPKRESPVTNTYKLSITGAKLGIHPGRHKFVASAEGVPDQVWEVTLENGSQHSHSFNFDKGGPVTAEGFTAEDQAGLTGEQPTDEDSDGLPAYPFVAGGITVAVAVPWVIFMVMSSSQKSDYDAARTARSPDQEELKSDLETTNLLADVFMAVTATGAVATIVLAIVAATTDGDDEETTEDDSEEDSEAAGRGVQWALTPAVDLRGGGSAQLVVRF